VKHEEFREPDRDHDVAFLVLETPTPESQEFVFRAHRFSVLAGIPVATPTDGD
jgi:hypothetical protein